MSARIPLLEVWNFGGGDRDTCVMTRAYTGEVLRRDSWPAGKAPVMLMPGFRSPRAANVSFATREMSVTPDDLARIRETPAPHSG